MGMYINEAINANSMLDKTILQANDAIESLNSSLSELDDSIDVLATNSKVEIEKQIKSIDELKIKIERLKTSIMLKAQEIDTRIESEKLAEKEENSNE